MSIDLLPHQADGMDQDLRGDFTGTWKSSPSFDYLVLYQNRDSIIVVLQYIDDGEDNGEDDDEWW